MQQPNTSDASNLFRFQLRSVAQRFLAVRLSSNAAPPAAHSPRSPAAFTFDAASQTQLALFAKDTHLALQRTTLFDVSFLKPEDESSLYLIFVATYTPNEAL